MFEATVVAIALVGAAALAFGIAALRGRNRVGGYQDGDEADACDGGYDD